MKDIEFVIAKYKEDTSWIDILHPYRYRIYNKDDGGDLPNIGREAHTYLHHIIENYDKLADVTVFLQGNPFLHTTKITNVHKNKDEIKKLMETYPFDKTEPFFTEYTHTVNDARGVYNRLFGYENCNITFTGGALWIVQKSDILARPRIFYEIIQKELIEMEGRGHEHNTFNPWTLERIWQFIFNPSLTIIPSFYAKT